MPGPPPKRSDQRRRRNKPERPVDKAPATAGKFEPPKADEAWHPAAARWYRSLSDSGQRVFYEPSDWTTAWLVAESMSRELRPQPVVDKDGHVTMVTFPPKGASMMAWLKAMTALMVTEGDRRRLRLELERQPAGDKEKPAGVSWIDDARNRLREPG